MSGADCLHSATLAKCAESFRLLAMGSKLTHAGQANGGVGHQLIEVSHQLRIRHHRQGVQRLASLAGTEALVKGPNGRKHGHTGAEPGCLVGQDLRAGPMLVLAQLSDRA